MKLIHRNHLHFYILTMKNQKEKLRNQSHLPWQQKKIKYLGINLSKETKELYTENFKTLMKEIKDDIKRWSDIPFSWVSSVQLLSHVRLFATPFTTAHQALLSITNSHSLLKLMSIESVMPSNHLILHRPLLPCPQSFPVSQLFASGGQSVGVSTSASVLPMNTQDWSALGWTGWNSLQCIRDCIESVDCIW